jgi:hypothetical protein
VGRERERESTEFAEGLERYATEGVVRHFRDGHQRHHNTARDRGAVHLDELGQHVIKSTKQRRADKIKKIYYKFKSYGVIENTILRRKVLG